MLRLVLNQRRCHTFWIIFCRPVDERTPDPFPLNKISDVRRFMSAALKVHELSLNCVQKILFTPSNYLRMVGNMQSVSQSIWFRIVAEIIVEMISFLGAIDCIILCMCTFLGDHTGRKRCSWDLSELAIRRLETIRGNVFAVSCYL